MRLNIRNHRALRFGALLACSILATTLMIEPAAGQSGLGSGRMEGTVLDESGGTVADATVTVRNDATALTSVQTSDPSGHFLFPYLTPGTYHVSVERSGFKTTQLDSVVVAVGTTITLRPQLTVGSADTKVVVTADLPLVDTTRSSVSSEVGQGVIENLPLNGRDFTDFVLLTPGATTDGEFGMVSFNGISGNFNNYEVDGGNNNNAFFSQQIGRGTIPFQFSEDVVQEFQVNTAGYEAEFGQSGGGLVNTVTKSGGNSIHGDAYYYFLDSALNANDSINNELGIAKPPNRRQQFGATVGGPLKKDKLFYIANYEGQVRNEPVTINDNPALQTLGDAAAQSAFLAANPSVANLLAANSGSFPRSFNQNTGFAKLSGQLTPRNAFSASYNYQKFTSPHGYFNTPTSTGDGLSLTDGSTSHFLQFSLISTLSPKMFNEARFHFANDLHYDLPDSAPTAPSTVIQNPDTGYVFGGNRFQLSTTDRRYEMADNFTYIVGTHTLRAGVDVNINHDRDYFVYGPGGDFHFASLADVATGAFEYDLQSFGQSTAIFTAPTYSLFVEDKFQATSRLNLNYGVRWDYQQLPQPKVCNPASTLTCSIPRDQNNVAPRFGFAYSLDSKGGTVVRGSFGVFFIQEDLLDVSDALVSNGISRQFVFLTGPGFGNNSPLVTYPNALTAPPASGAGGQSLHVFVPNFRNPYVEQANLTVEHKFGAKTSMSVGYVYTHGVALLGNSNGVTRQANGNFGYDLNLVPPDQQIAFGGNFTQATVNLPNGKSYVVPEFEAIDGLLDPNFSAINAVDNSGESVYHGLLVSARHQSGQFLGALAYTFSKTIDQGTGYMNQFDQASQRGPSQLDQTHRLVLSGSWFPVMRGLKGFTFSAVATVGSGRPYTAVFDTPNVNFSIVPGEGFNSFRGPGVRDVDVSVARAFKLNERFGIKLRAEAFNVLNHANFQQSAVDNVQYATTQECTPVNDPNCTSLNIWDASVNTDFGHPLFAAPKYGSRNIQLSARFEF
jgi:Carboxypeptidase regulatory-like domain/TonB dependent receptor